jgi:hemerythrin
MRKFQVTYGVYLLDCSEVGLRILCGCPMDTIKLLMRAGLIQHIEDDNWLWESGANAILLSDVSVQNGAFCNLTEFPLMHILYNQGLGVPNHPGYTGLKPLLIGIPEQIKGQIEYLDRGMNGLSREELSKVPQLSEEDQRALLAYKNRFKYGEQRSSQEIIDFKEIRTNEKPYELAPGLVLVRLGLNVYLFQYGDQEEIIDLTLTDNQFYGIPYNLDYHPAHKRDFSVIHSGEGNGWDKDRPCMSSIICAEGKYYLIDAGPNVLEGLTKLGISISEVEGVFLTHAHDDHFNGLTGLIRSQKRLKFFASPVVRVSVMRKLVALLNFSESLFSSFFDIHDLSLNEWNFIGRLQVMPILSPHPVETNIYYFRMEDGVGGMRSYGHLADLISNRVHNSFLAVEDEDQFFLQERYHDVWSSYLRATNVKKVDANSGLIHGEIENFLTDTSLKLVVSHTTGTPQVYQRMIGSTVNFGVEELLLPATKDYLAETSLAYMDDIFPNVPNNLKLNLLRKRRILINPGSIIIRDNDPMDAVYLIISGICEHLNDRTALRYEAGRILGEFEALQRVVCQGTYRAVSFVKAIKIKADEFFHFVKNNVNFSYYMQQFTERAVLRKSLLFNEISSRNLLYKIGKNLKKIEYSEGSFLDEGKNRCIGLITEGMVGVFHKENLVETLSEGSFYGQEVFFAKPRDIIPSVVALSNVKIMRISLEDCEDVPLLLWNLLETGDKIGKLVAQVDRLASHMDHLAEDLMTTMPNDD